MSQGSPAPDLPLNKLTQSSSPSQISLPQADLELKHDVGTAPTSAGMPLAAPKVASEGQQLESMVAMGSHLVKPPVSPNVSRSFGVQSILNPAQDRTVEDSGQGFGDHQSRRATQSVAASLAMAKGPTNVISQRQGQSTEGGGNHADGSVRIKSTRPMSTPKSPSTRTPILGAVQHQKPPTDSTFQPSGQENRTALEEVRAQRIAEANPYTAFPPNTSSTRPPTYTSLPDPASFAHSRRTSGGSGLGLVSQSQEPSPSTSHSSYSHLSQTSPAAGFGLPPRAPQGFPPIGQQTVTPHRPLSNLSTGPSSSVPAGGHLFDLSHGSYEMTLDTENGPLRVPVDVQQASHIADEKRKRNAGASARFRARRKEKEREASQTIANLEKELRETAEERDFYASERNFFRDLASRHVQVPIRPPSPRHRRLPPPPTVSPQFQTDEGRGEPPSRNLRRRTSDYQPTTAAAPPIAPVASRPPFGAPPAFQMPFPEIRPAAGREAPPPTSLPPRVERYDPFRQGSYDRSWNPSR